MGRAEDALDIETGHLLSKSTTIGTGGPAAAFARPQSLAELEKALRWGRERGLAIVTVGLGSNLLAADGGVDALVLRLEGDLEKTLTIVKKSIDLLEERKAAPAEA